MVTSLDNLSNAVSQKNDTVEKLVMINKTLTDSIASIQAQNLKLVNIVEKLTEGTPAAAKPSKDDKPPWDPTGYYWSHVYKIHRGHNSATRNTRKPGHNTTEKCGDIKYTSLGFIGGCLKVDGAQQQGTT